MGDNTEADAVSKEITMKETTPSPVEEINEPLVTNNILMQRTPERKSPSCGRGKTMKDYEEELIELRRDNFDLRMRIYLMEEQDEASGAETSILTKLPPSFQAIKDLHITNTQLKDEITNLKKELSEKEALVVQAAEAIEALEKAHNEAITVVVERAEKEKNELLQNVEHLNKELSDLKEVQKSVTQQLKVGQSIMNESEVIYATAFGFPTPYKKQPSAKDLDQEKILSLEVQVACLEKDLKEETVRRMESDFELDKVRSELEKLEEARQSLSEQLNHRESELAKAHKLIEDKCNSIHLLEEKLSRVPPLHTLYKKKEVDPHPSGGLSDLEKQVEVLSEKLKSKDLEIELVRCENMKAMRTIQGFVKQNKALTRDIEEMKSKLGDKSSAQPAKQEGSCEATSNLEKDNKIIELENEISSLRDELAGFKSGLYCEADDYKKENCTESLVSSLRADLESKRKEIELLNEELRKRTFNLQELVNTELWDKNREIEKLNKAFERKQIEVGCLKQDLTSKNTELSMLQEKFKHFIDHGKSLEMQQLCCVDLKENTNPNIPLTITNEVKEQIERLSDENKTLMLEAETLRNRLHEQIGITDTLKGEVDIWKKDAEESEKSRKELVNACTLLTTRLEELATFMESLLPSLGSKKRRMLQQAIDRSREMSRSFSFIDQSNLSIPILPDVSQVDFCSGEESLKLEVKVSENDEVVKLRTQVESLVDRLKKKETSPEKSKMWSLEEEQLEDITEGSLFDSIESETDRPKRASLAIIARSAVEEPQACLSESDGGWSEPDRNVSKQRIGIDDSLVCQAVVNSSEESCRSFKKSPSGKKIRSEGMVELRKLSAKLNSLELMNEALHKELLLLHQANAVKSSQIQKTVNLAPLSPQSLLEKVKSQRKHLELTLKCGEQSGNNKESELLNEIEDISSQLEKSCRLCLELEDRVNRLDQEKQAVEQRLETADLKIMTLSAELDVAHASLIQKENALLEKQCLLLEAQNQEILLKAKLENASENLSMKQNLIDKLEKEISELKERISNLESEASESLKTYEEKENSLKEKLISMENELEVEVKRRMEVEKRLVESYECQAEIRSRLDQEVLRSRDMESHFKLEERNWRRKVAESEEARLEREAELRKKLDAAVLTTSEAVLERTRLANDKLRLQHDLRAKETTHYSIMKELERRVIELEGVNSELESTRSGFEVRQDPIGARSPVTTSPVSRSPPISPRSPPLRRQQSNPSSDYVSDQDYHQVGNVNYWLPANLRSNNNSSPDLGIESDNHSLALRASSYDHLPSCIPPGDVGKLEAENAQLRRHLTKTRKALEDTLNQLTCANHKKKQVERAICKQLHKTHHILQKARVNLETEQPLSQ